MSNRDLPWSRDFLSSGPRVFEEDPLAEPLAPPRAVLDTRTDQFTALHGRSPLFGDTLKTGDTIWQYTPPGIWLQKYEGRQIVREFETGATRDTEDGKYDFEGALSPLVLWAFAGYMHKHRFLKDGTVRSADNWQKGFPEDVLVKSLLRHVMDLWLLHRGHEVTRPEDGKEVDWDDALGGILFNAQALWHERLDG